STTPILTAIIIGVGAIVAGAVTRLVMARVQVLLYVVLGMRREGFDIALQSATSDGGGQSALDFGQVWAEAPARWSEPEPLAHKPPAHKPPAHSDTPPDQQRW